MRAHEKFNLMAIGSSVIWGLIIAGWTGSLFWGIVAGALLAYSTTQSGLLRT